MNFKDILTFLTKKAGIAGDEFSASYAACELLKKFAQDAYVDDFGNVIGEIGERDEDKPNILLDAHIDEIGFIVNYITDDGFLKISRCGGIDNRVILAQQVTILGKEKLHGVITSVPPHLESVKTKVIKAEDVFVDIGFDKESAQKLVSLGDRVYIDNKITELLNGKLTSKSLDDRTGVAVILMALESVIGKELPFNMTVQFSAQEETGERGAKVAAFKNNPDYAIAVDVSFAFTSDDKPEKCGIMGKGPMIGVAPSLSRAFSDKLIDLAKNDNIPYQIEVMNGETGTNADAISSTRNGVITSTVSIPLKYMHTPVEVVSVSDLENCSKLIAAFLENGI